MKTREWRIENGGWTTRSVLKCGGKQSATPLSRRVAAADPDHDGQSNLNEYLAGTNPTNAASVFRMISATVSSPDVRVDWTAVGGHSYEVQINSDLGAGLFGDLSPLITVSGTDEGTTNYVQAGGATNGTGFYRVRLGP